jgi:hypothetical protein
MRILFPGIETLLSKPRNNVAEEFIANGERQRKYSFHNVSLWLVGTIDTKIQSPVTLLAINSFFVSYLKRSQNYLFDTTVLGLAVTLTLSPILWSTVVERPEYEADPCCSYTSRFQICRSLLLWFLGSIINPLKIKIPSKTMRGKPTNTPIIHSVY